MFNENDINERIKSDFGDKALEAFQLLDEAISKTDYLNLPRIIRCIVFLSVGNINELKRHIEIATYDTRDVMFWAEYLKGQQEFKYKRVRDFNKTFALSELDVKE